MPVANKEQKEQKQQSRNTNTKHSWRGPLGAFIVAVAILAIGFMITLYNSGGITLGQQTKFEKYLNEKYGQEFVIENVRVTGAGLGVKGAWRADAYPKSDPSIKFEIRRSQTTNEIDYETFLQTLWTKEGSIETESFMTKSLPNNEGYYLIITPGTSPGNTLYDSIQGSTPSLNEALKSHKDDIAYTLTVNDVIRTSEAEPSATSLENAKKVVDFVKAQGAGILSVNYGYRDASFTEKNSSGQQKYQYRIKLEREALQKVNSSSDLKHYFEVIKY